MGKVSALAGRGRDQLLHCLGENQPELAGISSFMPEGALDGNRGERRLAFRGLRGELTGCEVLVTLRQTPQLINAAQGALSSWFDKQRRNGGPLEAGLWLFNCLLGSAAYREQEAGVGAGLSPPPPLPRSSPHLCTSTGP